MTANAKAWVPPLTEEHESDENIEELYEEALKSARSAVARGRKKNDDLFERFLFEKIYAENN